MNKFLEKTKSIFIIFGKHMRIFLVLAFLSITFLTVTAFLVNMPVDYSTDDLSINKDYLINARSLKIHKLDCPAIDKMSENNKIICNGEVFTRVYRYVGNKAE